MRTSVKYVLVGFLMVMLSWSCTGQQSKSSESSESSETNKKDNKMSTISLTKSGFLKRVANYEATPNEWKYLGDKPCIIDFYASWCGPCKQIAPILEELAKEYEDQIYIYKIDTEKEQELSAAFGIQSIPTLLFCPMNGEPQMVQGAMSKAGFEEAIKSILLKK